MKIQKGENYNNKTPVLKTGSIKVKLENMKMPKIFLTILITFICNSLYSQNNISLDVPSELVIDAGADTTVNQYEIVVLGGNPTAQFGITPYSYEWAPNNNLNSGAIANPISNPADTIVYSLTVTDANGCMATDSIVVNIQLADIKEWGVDQFKLYPNPSLDELFFISQDYSGRLRLKIVDIQSKVLLDKEVQIQKFVPERIDLKELASGSYIVILENEKFRISQSFIIK